MRLLITGATGFAGNAYLKLAISKGHDVVVLGRTKPAAEVTFIETDLTKKESVFAVADKISGDFDALINLAAYVPKKSDDDNLFDAENVNIRGLVNLLEALSGRFKKHIFGSTAEVYDQRLIESKKLGSKTAVGPLSYYATTKLAGEYISLSFGRKNTVPTTVLRFSVMYGPDDPINRAIPNFIKSAIKGDNITISGGLAKRDYIHVDDVAQSIESAIESSYEGVLAIGTGVGITIEDIARKIVAVAKSSSVVNSDVKGGVDIVIDTEETFKAIGFKAEHIFPADLITVIDSYRS